MLRDTIGGLIPLNNHHLKTMKIKIIGWILISVALLISAYSNYNPLYNYVFNPATILGIILYAVGTVLIFIKNMEEQK